MKIETFVLGPVRTNCYIGVNEETKECFVVDPGDGPDYFLNHFEEQGWTLKGILLTHGHFDHVTGVKPLVDKFGVPIYAMSSEIELLASAELNESIRFRRPVTLTGVIGLADGESLELAGVSIRAIATPGHTIGGGCYYLESEKVLFSGDTLFARSVGRSDFPTGNHEELINSIRTQLFVLPEETMVYPGHMSETTIGYEKENNPFA